MGLTGGKLVLRAQNALPLSTKLTRINTRKCSIDLRAAATPMLISEHFAESDSASNVPQRLAQVPAAAEQL